MGVAHKAQKCWQELIESNHSFDQIHSSATPPPLPPLPPNPKEKVSKFENSNNQNVVDFTVS